MASRLDFEGAQRALEVLWPVIEAHGTFRWGETGEAETVSSAVAAAMRCTLEADRIDSAVAACARLLERLPRPVGGPETRHAQETTPRAVAAASTV